MRAKKNILIAPLNWGLGHATRCVPIINELINNGYVPIIASDGAALDLLQKEFPMVQTLRLPSYCIKYPKNGNYFKWKLILNLPRLVFAIYKERKTVEKWITDHNIDGIISDNRFGVFSKKIPSVYITHQLKVLSGNTTGISSFLHQKIIKKYSECWVPDCFENSNLSGDLGHLFATKLNLKYIGILSRLNKKVLPMKYDLMVLLSGPEPQRSMLEIQLKAEISNYSGNVIFVEGIIESEQKLKQIGKILYYNFMKTNELETAINQSELVLCRSGYTTIMDLTKLEKKVFFIPTPGQFEQEYLAKKMYKGGLAPYCKQSDFNLKKLVETKKHTPLKMPKSEIDWKDVFNVFE
jgi:uncharacterized protein (TIGR00661 family)